MYSRLLSAAIVAGLMPATCDPVQGLDGSPFGESSFSVAAPDFDLAFGGKVALLLEGTDPPPDDDDDGDEPSLPPDGPHDPANE